MDFNCESFDRRSAVDDEPRRFRIGGRQAGACPRLSARSDRLGSGILPVAPARQFHGVPENETERAGRAHGLPPQAGPYSGPAGVAPKVKLQPGESDPADEQVAVWRSQWSIPQLTSFIYPANRDRFIWNPPGGGQIIFAREDIEGTFPKFTPEGWACAEVAPGIYRIFDREGWSWRYENGLPATLTAPSGRYLEFTHDKGLLTRIVQRLSLTDKATQQIVLQVKYDAQRRPLQIDSGPIEHRFTYDDKTGHLLAWHSTAFKLGEAPDAQVKPDEIRPESNPAIAIAPGDEHANPHSTEVPGADARSAGCA